MKNKFLAFLVAFTAVVSLTGASAAEKPVAIVVDGSTLHVFGPDGGEIGTGYPAGTVDQAISAGPYAFTVSFGADANGNPSVIVTPSKDNPTSLNLTINGRSIQMDKTSVVTATIGSNGVTNIVPGAASNVKIDGQTTVAAPGATSTGTTATGSSTSTANGGSTNQPPQAQGSTTDTSKNTTPDPTAPTTGTGTGTGTSFNASGSAVASNNPQTNDVPTAPVNTSPA